MERLERTHRNKEYTLLATFAYDRPSLVVRIWSVELRGRQTCNEESKGSIQRQKRRNLMVNVVREFERSVLGL